MHRSHFNNYYFVFIFQFSVNELNIAKLVTNHFTLVVFTTALVRHITLIKEKYFPNQTFTGQTLFVNCLMDLHIFIVTADYL